MKKYILLLLCSPLIMLAQSGISLSGSSDFFIGQNIIPLSNTNFETINYTSRNYQVSLSVFRGRKFRIGTFAINATFSYDISSVEYTPKNTLIQEYETIENRFIPQLELWYIVLQTQNIFVYTSIGGYAMMQDLTISKESNPNELTNDIESTYNQLTPFLRTGVQFNYGRFFMNPFISFDLEEIYFNKLKDLSNIDLLDQIKNHNVRSGIEFGIMF